MKSEALMLDVNSIVRADHAHVVHPLFHPVDQQEPFVWVEGEGAVLRSADGREFIDGLACLWNVNVGHGRRSLAQAAARQMEQLAFATAYTGSTNIPLVQLAERLATKCYPGISRFFFTSGGAEANDTAIKTARFYWGTLGRPEKFKVISRELAYHGVTIGSMYATGLPMYWPMFGQRPAGFVHIPSPYPYRFLSDDAGGSGRAAADLLEQAIVHEGPETIAAFIAEPVQGVGGVIVPPPDYFPRIREICDKYEILFIADEVITGFCRTGRWFGLEHWNVKPDILSFAKGVTSGYIPLGGVGFSDKVYEVLANAPPEKRWMHAYTYSGHPTSCAVALANLDILEKENLVDAARVKGERLLAGLKQLESHPNVGEVRGIGLMAAVELVEDKATRKPFAAARKTGTRLYKECVKRGLWSRFREDIYMLAPPLVIREDQIDRIINILGDAIPAAVQD